MSLNAHLKSLLQDLSAELPEVTERFMFGSDAFFANTNIYALVWDGRVVLRFPNQEKFVTARDLEDAAIFDPMGSGKTRRSPTASPQGALRKWVCMPESMADDVEALRPWVEEAHREAMMEPPRKKKSASKKKTTTASRAPARRTGKAPASRASRAGSRRGSR
ncbi:MAG: TfoX/Sxy family protein [Archangium sp.]|nr:TfoX/Sxy family protein [Archangium sp.]